MADTATVLGPAAAAGDPSPGRSAGSVLRAMGDSPWIPSVVLIVALLVLWEVAALTFLADSKAFPPVTDVVGDVVGDLDVYLRNARTTLRAALPGWFWGNVIATVMGALAVAVPAARTPHAAHGGGDHVAAHHRPRADLPGHAGGRRPPLRAGRPRRVLHHARRHHRGLAGLRPVERRPDPGPRWRAPRGAALGPRPGGAARLLRRPQDLGARRGARRHHRRVHRRVRERARRGAHRRPRQRRLGAGVGRGTGGDGRRRAWATP